MIGKVKGQMIGSSTRDPTTMYMKKNNTSYSIPNGKLLMVEGIGDIEISKYLKLKNVLNVPNFNNNLISISKITHDLGVGYSV